MKTATKQCKADTSASLKTKADNSVKPAKLAVRSSKPKRKVTGKTKMDACRDSLLFHKPETLNQAMAASFPKSASQFPVVENGQCPVCFRKFKLQLFPIDNATHKRLEDDQHNPYLELTLSTQKKMSSVVKHLNSKWQISRASTEELVLFPYDVQMDNLSNYWTLKDSRITAAEVYAAVGSPYIFRLRYGWLPADSLPEMQGIYTTPSFLQQNQELNMDELTFPSPGLDEDANHAASQFDDFGLDMIMETPWPSEVAEPSWAYCLKKSTAGALVSEASRFTCDTFDADIDAHLARVQAAPPPKPSAQMSILDAEETCMPFPFQRDGSTSKEVPTSCTDSATLNKPMRNGSCQGAQVGVPSLIHAQEDPSSNGEGDAGHEAAAIEVLHDCDNPDGIEGFNWSNSQGPWADGGSLFNPNHADDSFGFGNLLSISLDAFHALPPIF